MERSKHASKRARVSLGRAQARVHDAVAVCCALVVLTALAAGCMSEPPPAPPDLGAGNREPYVLGPSDVISIYVWKNPELGGQMVVRSDGMISVPLLDDVQAEGLTPEELKEVISERLSEFVAHPDVTVTVIGMNSNTVAILGGVMRSGEIPISRETRVLQAIARSGGFSTWAKKNQVRILRPNGGDLVEYRFDYGAYVAGKAPGTNLVLRPGDTIVVPD